MPRAAVLGQPIAHSMSPILHTAGYKARGLDDWSYSRIETDAQTLPGILTLSTPASRVYPQSSVTG